MTKVKSVIRTMYMVESLEVEDEVSRTTRLMNPGAMIM